MGRQSDALHSAPQPSNSTALATAPVVAPASYIGTILSHLDAVHDVEAMPRTAARATLCGGSARGSAGVTWTSRIEGGSHAKTDPALRAPSEGNAGPLSGGVR